MAWQYTHLLIPLLVSTVIATTLAVTAWQRRRFPGALPFAMLMSAAAWWTVGYALELHATELAAKTVFSGLLFAGVVAVPVAWLTLALEYSGHSHLITRRNLLLLGIVPATSLLLHWTNSLHGLMWSSSSIIEQNGLLILKLTFGPAFWLHATYSYLLNLVGALLIVRTLVHLPRLYRGQILGSLLGILAPWFANAIHIIGWRSFQYLDPTPFAFTLTGLSLAYSVFRFRLFDLVPIARSAVVESLTDPVLILDLENHILDANPSAAALFERPAQQLLGQEMTKALSRWPVIVQHYRNHWTAHEEISLQRGEQTLSYDLRISPLHNQQGSLAGRLMVLHDISAYKRVETELRARQRYLTLLNDLTRGAVETLDFGQMLQTLADRMAELDNADGSLITFWDEDTQTVKPVAASGPGSYYPNRQPPVGKEISLTGTVLKLGKVLAIEDAPSSPYLWHKMFDQFLVQSALALPLIIDGVKLGAVILAYQQPRAFHADEIARAEQAAGQVALAIAKAQSLQTAQRRRQIADTLRGIAQQVSSTLELDRVVEYILDQLGSLIPYQTASLQLVEKGQRRVVGGRGFQPVNSDDGNAHIWRPVDEDELISTVLRTRQAVLITDTRLDPRWEPHPSTNHVFSWVAAPLVVGQEAVGFLTLDHGQPGAYNEETAELATAVAAQAAIAIQNAWLYEEVRRLAITDPLTGLYNRRGLINLGQREIERAHRFGRHLAAILLDIDHFKEVNDTYKHATGDLALIAVAECMRQRTREVDVVGRYGGDEILILLPETDEGAAMAVAERLRQAVSGVTLTPDSRPLHLTISLGVACSNSSGVTLETLIDMADIALYAAKEAGRNCVRLYRPGPTARLDITSIESDARVQPI